MPLKRKTVTVDNRMSKRFKPTARARKSRGVTAAVKKLLADKTEFKVFETNQTVTAIPQFGGIRNLISIVQGDSSSERSGNVINVQSVMVDFRVHAPQDGGIDDVIQCALVWCASPNGVNPTYSQIYEVQAGLYGQAYKDFAADDEQFTILWNERSDVFAGSDTNYAQWDNCHFRKYYSVDASLKSPKTRYDGNTTIPTTGGLYLTWACNQNSITPTQNSSVSYTTLVRYTDK